MTIPMMTFVRYVLPAAIFFAGVVILALGGDHAWEAAAGFMGAGGAVLLLNILYRIGVSGDRDGTQADEARRYFDRHGRWPDDPPRD